MGNAARPIYLGIGFGHAATLEKSDSGAVITIRGPRGVPPIVLDISVAEAGATVRLRDATLHAPPASIGSMRAPASSGDVARFDPPISSAPAPVTTPSGPAPLSIAASPIQTAASFEPRLSLQQYASLRAACVSASYERLSEVRGQYSLDEAGDAAEADAWARKFSQDPTLFESYRHFFQMFRATTSPGVSTMSSTPSSRPPPSPQKPPSFK